MFRYLVRRCFSIPLMLIGITFLTCLTLSFLPGGPISQMTDMNPKVSQEVKDRLIKQYDLDKPFHVRYGKWLFNVFKLDFGRSFKDQQPVIDKIWDRLPKTLLLTGLSLIITFLLAVPIGILCAVKQNSLWDRGLTVFVFLGFSIPTHWLALLLIIEFSIRLGWFPITGFQSLMADELPFWSRLWDIARHLALPLIVTGLTSLAGLSRYMRNGMLEVIRQDFIRAARAKGLSERKIIYVHALRNSLITIITLLGLSLPGLISAGVIFETIFSYPGLGRLMYEAAISRDFQLIMASVTFAAFLTLVGNLLADLCYAVADPRIRYQ